MWRERLLPNSEASSSIHPIFLPHGMLLRIAATGKVLHATLKQGTIPEEVGNLIGLIALNLSGNQFFGKIPQSIGKLYQLQNLDLSRNHLSGSIPLAIVSLTFLSHLNLSYNNLSGIIPRGNQLDTLDESNYMGNEGLCGQPLRKECKSDGRDQIPVQPLGDEEFEDESEMRWIYVGIVPGFAIGLVSVFGILLFKRSWRIIYFRFVDGLQDWFCWNIVRRV
ncbi:putative receptor like protein 25 [Aristolochia californica]|uniref:putative receptor like protein 25 n=1 Tax=Aristolochia californica TaxID=171875 RepID=UPI0035DB7FF6